MLQRAKPDRWPVRLWLLAVRGVNFLLTPAPAYAIHAGIGTSPDNRANRAQGENEMQIVPIYRLIEWLRHPDTHPLVVEACRAELLRRGFDA
jgi:hypothetical protein